MGSSLLRRATEHAFCLELEQLRLVLRGGEGLEEFYIRHGWTENGCDRNALRLRNGDDRDEVSMALTLA